MYCTVCIHFEKSFDFIRIPGRLNDRRTPLGELNWIFTAVTDTIAWNVLPRGKTNNNNNNNNNNNDLLVIHPQSGSSLTKCTNTITLYTKLNFMSV